MTKPSTGSPPARARSGPNRSARPGFATFHDGGRGALVDADGNPDFIALRQSEDFQRLRRTSLRFVFPVTLLFLTWYLTYVLASAYAPDLMGTPLLGAVNVGLVLGLLQFASTAAITLAYARYARRNIDPQVEAVRELAGVDRR